MTFKQVDLKLIKRLTIIYFVLTGLLSSIAAAGGIQQTTDISYQYDSQGNVVRQDSVLTAYEENADGGQPAQHQYRTLIVNSYSPFDLTKWQLGQLVCSQTVKQIVTPSTDLSNLGQGIADTVTSQATTFAYNTSSNTDKISTQINGSLAPVDPNTISSCNSPTNNIVNSSYSYDLYGNILSVSTSAGTGASSLSVTNSTSYSADYRYPATRTNAVGQKEIYTYYSNRGLIASKTFIDGTKETYNYDDVGRLSQKTNTDNTSTKIIYTDCGVSDCDSSGAEQYYTISTVFDPTNVQVLSPITSYFDSLGRKTRTLTNIFTDPNAQISQTQVSDRTTYDTYGRVSATYSPYLLSDSAANIALGQTSINYDAFDRPISILDASTGKMLTKQYYNPFTTMTLQQSCVSPTCTPDSSKTEVSDGLNQQIMIIDSKGSRLRKVRDAAGNLRQTIDSKNNAITISYDLAGHKLTMSDPDAGTLSYAYDAFGRLQTQTDAKGQITTFQYDALNRIVNRMEADKNSNWVFDNSTGNSSSGKLTQTYTLANSVQDYSESYFFDSLGRRIQTQTSGLIDPTGNGNTTFNTSISYDNLSRPISITYPNGQSYRNEYDAYGNLLRVLNADGTKVHWQVISRDRWNRVLQEKLGSGLTTTRSYDFARSTLNGISTLSAVNNNGTITNTIVQNDTYHFDVYGNLLNRTDQMTGYSEDALYDSLNRLLYLSQKNINQNQLIQNNQYTYDSIGNLLHKTAEGDYQYGHAGQSGCAGVHQVCQITSGSPSSIIASLQYDSNGNVLNGNGHSIQWTSFDKVSRMNSDNGYEEDYLYDTNHTRLRKTQYLFGTLKSTIVYINPRLDMGETFERSYSYANGSVNKVEDRTHLYAEGRPIGQIVNITDANGQLLDNHTDYFLTDHLGSIKIVTDEFGAVKERTTFDVWGNRVALTGVIVTRHGFTGHEEMDDESLVNMNGRIYDPKIARFLSADPYIDGVEDLQGYNRYSYVQNNPLSLIDPSGFDWITSSEGSYDTGYLMMSTRLNLPNIPSNISFVGPASNPLSILGNTAVIINVGSSPFRTGPQNIAIGNYTPTSVNSGRNLSSTNSTTTPPPASVSSPTGSVGAPATSHTASNPLVKGKSGNSNGALISNVLSFVHSLRSGINAADDAIFFGLPARLFPNIYEVDESDYLTYLGRGAGLAAGMATGSTELKFGTSAIEKVPALIDEGSTLLTKAVKGEPLEYAPRIRQRAVENPGGHNFPFSFDKVILSTKPVTLRGGAEGYALRGYKQKSEVIYNIIVKDGQIIHRDLISVDKWAQRSKSFGWPQKLEDIPRVGQ